MSGHKVSKEYSRSTPVKLLASGLLCGFLIACGGGGSSSVEPGPTNPDITNPGTTDPGEPSAGMSCDSLKRDEHDGMCALIAGVERSAFYRNIFIDYRPSQPKGNAQYHFSPKTIAYTGSFAVEFPLDQGAELDCNDAGVIITAAWKEGTKVNNFTSDQGGGSCNVQFASTGRVITGQFGGTLGDGDGNTVELTDGYFRISLEGASDHVKGHPKGVTNERGLGAVDIQFYQPGGKLRFTASSGTGSGSDEQWIIWIDDLGQSTGTAVCNGSFDGNQVSYRPEGGGNRDLIEDIENCAIDYSVDGSGVLSGQFRGDHAGSFSISLPDGPIVSNLP